MRCSLWFDFSIIDKSLCHFCRKRKGKSPFEPFVWREDHVGHHRSSFFVHGHHCRTCCGHFLGDGCRSRRFVGPARDVCRTRQARRNHRQSLQNCAAHRHHQKRRLRNHGSDRTHCSQEGRPGNQVQGKPQTATHSRGYPCLWPLCRLQQQG